MWPAVGAPVMAASQRRLMTSLVGNEPNQTITVGAYVAKTWLSELLALVSKGEVVTTTKHDHPIAHACGSDSRHRGGAGGHGGPASLPGPRVTGRRACVGRGGAAIVSVVLDASAALALVVPDEGGSTERWVGLLTCEPIEVPDLWHYEVANALVVGVLPRVPL